MGVSTFNSGQSFSSDNREVVKLLRRAEKACRLEEAELEDVTNLIMSAITIDRKIQQNLLSTVEKLSKSGHFTAAECYANASIRAISRYNKDESMYFGLSLPKEVYCNDVYRILIQICQKMGYFSAYENLIDCLKDDDYQQSLLREDIREDIGNRKSMIFAVLTKRHLTERGIVNRSLNEERIINAPLRIPAICIMYRGLLKRIVTRDLRIKYHKSLLGWVWGLMEPIALTLTFLLIYEIMATEPTKYRAISIMIGILFWSFFATSLKRGTVFLESNVRLIQKVSLPKEIFLLSNVGFAIATLAINALALIPFMFYYEITPSINILLVPLLVIMIASLTIGVSMFTSIFHSRLRDTGEIINVATRVGFYFTPVFYTIDMIANSRIPAEYLSAYLVANPIAVYLAVIRSSILNTAIPFSSMYILIAVLQTLVIYILGSYYYQAKQDQAVKYL